MSTATLVLLAGLYLAGFGLIHSVLAMDRVKALARRAMGRGFALYRLGYTVITFGLLVGYVVLFEPYDEPLYRVPMPWMAVALVISVASALLILWCLFIAFDGLEFLGIRQLGALRGERSSETDIPLRTTGPFGWCRHPVYLGTIVHFSVAPYMTVLLAVFAAFTLVYAFLGSIPEERRLLAHYGEVYADYQRRTPRIIPRLASFPGI